MSSLLYIVPCAAILLQGLLLVRLWRCGAASRYPHLAVFVLYRFLGDAILFPIYLYKTEWFAVSYWRLETITLTLQFLINWEFFRGVFPRRSALYAVAWKTLLVIEVITVPAIIALSWNQALSLQQLVRLQLSPLVEQYLCLAQAILLLAPVAAALYYRVPMGRNLRGLALGFGVFLLARSVNFASLQVFPGFALYWRWLTPATFIAMIAIWLWAFWNYSPRPQPGRSAEEASPREAGWRHLRNRIIVLSQRGV